MDWGLAKVLPRGGVAADAKAGMEPPAGDADRDGAERFGHGPFPRRLDPGHAQLHGPRAGPGRDRVDQRARRRVRPGLDPLRDPHRLAGLHWPRLRRDPPQGGVEATRPMPSPGWTAAGPRRELIALAKDCLAVEPEDRPRDAKVVSRADHGLPGGRSGAGAGGRARACRGRGAGHRGAAAAQGAARAGGLGAGVHDAGRAEHDVLPPAAGRAGQAASGASRGRRPGRGPGGHAPRPGQRAPRGPLALGGGAGRRRASRSRRR